MNMVCKCGGKEFFTEEHGNQTGLYCSACGKWQKWLKKDEIRLFNHGVKVENASLLERLKEIEKTLDFAAYSAGVALKEFGRCIKEAFGGTDKEVDDVCDSEH